MNNTAKELMRFAARVVPKLIRSGVDYARAARANRAAGTDRRNVRSRSQEVAEKRAARDAELAALESADK